MDDAHLMGMFQRECRLLRPPRNRADVGGRIPAQLGGRSGIAGDVVGRGNGVWRGCFSFGTKIGARLPPLLVPHRRQADAFDKFHRVIVHATCPTDLINRNDMGMVQM